MKYKKRHWKNHVTDCSVCSSPDGGTIITVTVIQNA